MDMSAPISPSDSSTAMMAGTASSTAASTPSPGATTSTTPATASSSQSHSTSSANNASRRPPRKSTLTQQQKNQKRQRATQDQLVTLEVEFNKNPTPTAATRERIASEINMTERSVQIWFQNSRRRAKIKAMAKKGLDGSDEIEHMPESMRQLMAMQAMEAGKFPGHFMRPGGPMTPYGGGMMLNGEQNGSGKVVIHHFSCRSLSIGTWRRVGQNAMDLVIFYSPDKACITYYINNDSAGYKIEFPFAFIKSIALEAGDAQPPPNGTPPRAGGLVIELTRPPHFFMDSSGSGGFFQCGDFTEDQQASQILTHHLGGHPKVLSGQLAKLVSLDSYQNRHNHFDLHAMPASAPVSPTMGIQRPASQPNVHFARPHPPHIGMFQENHFGINPHLHPGRLHPGHKRQRSRSVPIAIDFSMLHGPMPTFHIQQPSPQFGPGDNHPAMYHPMPHAPQPGPLGPNLHIDTSAGYGMDFRPIPMSATATSPSEFASPGFFPANPLHPPPLPAADFPGASYSMPFLSPSPMGDPSTMIPPSVTPLSQVSHHTEPVIADNSPPMSAMHRSASADMFQIGHDPAGISDESLLLSEMYSKQSLGLHMPGTPFDENGLMVLPEMSDFHHRDGLDMPMPMTPYGTIDPHSLQGGLPQ